MEIITSQKCFRFDHILEPWNARVYVQLGKHVCRVQVYTEIYIFFFHYVNTNLAYSVLVFLIHLVLRAVAAPINYRYERLL